jgi:hypothetical protein
MHGMKKEASEEPSEGAFIRSSSRRYSITLTRRVVSGNILGDWRLSNVTSKPCVLHQYLKEYPNQKQKESFSKNWCSLLS